MSKTFIEGLKTPFASVVKKFEINTADGKKEFGYLPWALALAMADRPILKVVETETGEKVFPVFGGGVVGVSETLPCGAEQVTWLPILNKANQAMPEGKITSRDASDTINRCRAKSIAMVNGVGLALFAHGLEDTVVFINSLRLMPDSDLATAQPHITRSPKKNGEFLDWTYALAAARLTDPNFHWEVDFRSVVDRDTGEVGMRPYFRLGSGWGVAVRVTYKGITHEEILPIMGFQDVQTRNGVKTLDHQPLSNPNAHDWNRSVMRCLTKAIACATGYGLSVYAKAEVEQMHVDPLPQSVPKATEAVAAPDDPKAKEALIADLTRALAADGKTASKLLSWLGHKDATDLSVASVEELERGLRALQPPPENPPAKQQPPAPAAARSKASPRAATQPPRQQASALL